MVSKRALKIAILLLKAAHHNLYTYDALWCTRCNSYNHKNILVYHLQYILRRSLDWSIWSSLALKGSICCTEWRLEEGGGGEKNTIRPSATLYKYIWSYFIWWSIWRSQTMFSSDMEKARNCIFNKVISMRIRIVMMTAHILGSRRCQKHWPCMERQQLHLWERNYHQHLFLKFRFDMVRWKCDMYSLIDKEGLLSQLQLEV